MIDKEDITNNKSTQHNPEFFVSMQIKYLIRILEENPTFICSVW